MSENGQRCEGAGLGVALAMPLCSRRCLGCLVNPAGLLVATGGVDGAVTTGVGTLVGEPMTGELVTGFMMRCCFLSF